MPNKASNKTDQILKTNLLTLLADAVVLAIVLYYFFEKSPFND